MRILIDATRDWTQEDLLRKVLKLTFQQDLIQRKPVYKNFQFQAGEGSYLKEHRMFTWYMTDNFSLKVLKITVLINEFLL